MDSSGSTCPGPTLSRGAETDAVLRGCAVGAVSCWNVQREPWQVARYFFTLLLVNASWVRLRVLERGM